jgi:hypothetical protein
MNDAHTIKFKIYFAKATCRSKIDLDRVYEKSWAIFKHHYFPDKQPMHDWCDPQWCKYFQASVNGQQFLHNSKSDIPRACLDMIKPVFHELCSRTSLAEHEIISLFIIFSQDPMQSVFFNKQKLMKLLHLHSRWSIISCSCINCLIIRWK